MKRPVSLEDHIIRFILVKQSENSHRLVLRLSHAQYDRISLPSILQVIKAAYKGTTLSSSKPTPPSSTVSAHKTPANPTHTRPRYSKTRTCTTFATTVKAAWALVLSSLAYTPDTVFGQVISGRIGSLSAIHDVVEPSLNILTVRVPLQHTWTNADLLRFIQNQHVASMPHENYSMRSIIERCTAWPEATRFSSIRQHTNFGKQFFGEVLSASRESEMMGSSPPHDVADVWIWTRPVRGGVLG
ncbi:uncharacterized protein CC84DRAFT_1218555 [Paraphaeosphaeria sporulosa]|uniref:Condensation domain-containing protein n=1 Tax=Paraphaeosphaeria sporulosa TaxID=1460663 RepID=A0A177CEL6_9PLEO|nr:uncharacterized protein CC84DRAFT_1218555 [Paraphaeosphaeria sporulosa]OAG05180.1 hypothetical protein CC84DRAFT_1218555 [Paraphaeosphaeria sporulosa]